MNYKFWNDYAYVSTNLAITLDKRLKNVSDRIENFFRNTLKEPFKNEYLEFYLAGSCLKRDSFNDIDMFFFTKDKLDEVLNNIDEKYFLYKNNSHTFSFEGELFQCVCREKFIGKDLKYVIDIFDFYSTKIGFKCKLDTKTYKLQIIQSDIREEFTKYLQDKRNDITRINQNPFVSLQRAIRFTRSGDHVPFGTFLNIIHEISKVDPIEDYEKSFQRLQGDGENFEAIKEAIEVFLKRKN